PRSNVSMTIMRPPQHGHEREGEVSSALLSSLAGASSFCGAGAASNSRAWGWGAAAGGQQAVMADAMESARQHVDEKTADELVRIERHRLVAIVSIDPIVFPFEGHARSVERGPPGVGDGDAMRVAGQIGQHRLWPAKGALGVDDPFGRA